MNLKNWWTHLAKGFSHNSDDDNANRYRVLRRNIFVLMILITIIPLTIMAGTYQHEYQSSIKKEIITPLQILANKTKHSLNFFWKSDFL